eukprot:6445070-Prymnesium_polylepis.1
MSALDRVDRVARNDNDEPRDPMDDFGGGQLPTIDDASPDSPGGGGGCLTLLQFTIQLLGPENRAVAPPYASDTQDMHERITHYWMACSHNS